MKSNRLNFIEKACLAGACFCGFSSLAAEAANSYIPTQMDEPDDPYNSSKGLWLR